MSHKSAESVNVNRVELRDLGFVIIHEVKDELNKVLLLEKSTKEFVRSAVPISFMDVDNITVFRHSEVGVSFTFRYSLFE